VKCNEAQDRLCEYFDNRLDEQARAGVEDHLISCTNCRIKADLLGRTNRLFAALPQVEPPAGFEARWMARLQEERSKPGFWQRLSTPFRNHIAIQAAAVVLVAVLATFLYQKERAPESLTQTAPGERSLEKTEASDPSAAQQAQRQRGREPQADKSKEASRQDQQEQREERLQEQAELKSAPPPAGGFAEPQSPVVGGRGEYVRAGAEIAVDYQVVVRVRSPARDNAVSGTRLESRQSDLQGAVSLSKEQLKSLEQARRRAGQTGQAQNELLSIPRDRYEQFKQELAAIGNIESDAAVGSRETQSTEQVMIMVTILPSAARTGSVPTQPNVR
jgi:anti-sigma factor RsiW